jgi:UDP-2,3-diacylglucosamine pyrophosphatase LpxH
VNIAVISDLHLGSEHGTDSFGHDDAEFLRFLTYLERNFERIVLLGDIWETLASRCPWRARAELATARSRHQEIARRFRGPKYQYVHGNHDLIAGEVDGAPEHLSFEADGKRLLFMHGHGHDRLIRAARRLVELGVCLGGWIRRAGCHRLYRWLDRVDQRRSLISTDVKECTFQRWALGEAHRHAADIVVTGHTHLPLSTELAGRRYMNSGTCSNGRITFLALETRRDVYGVHHAW